MPRDDLRCTRCASRVALSTSIAIICPALPIVIDGKADYKPAECGKLFRKLIAQISEGIVHPTLEVGTLLPHHCTGFPVALSVISMILNSP